MANTIQVKRGLESARSGVTPSSGEFLYTTDDKKTYIGDGSTAGGNALASVGVTQTFTAGQRGEVTTLTDGANIATNLALSNNFTVTLAGNRTLDNPTNLVAGQSGSIFVIQDATGSRTLSYGTYWKFVGGTAPTLSTAANAIDRIDYIVKSTTEVHAVASLDVK